jgi:signal transduction histidine kinase/ligand-binding sensor domain-containing protein
MRLVLSGRLIVCLTALFALSPSALAQYRFDHWTADNGLPQNSVRDIVQTRDGYLWFATFDGLVRFDGVRFTVFNKSSSPGLPGNRFVDLFEDRSGNLWATLDSGQVVRRDGGRFEVYARAPESPDDIRSTLADDGQGNVVVYYQYWDYQGPENVLTRITSRAYRCHDGELRPADDLSHVFPWPLRNRETIIGASWMLLDGDLWVCTDERVVRLLKTGGFQVYDERNGLPGTRPSLVRGQRLPIHVVSHDGAGGLWLTDLASGQSRLVSSQAPDGFDVIGGFADAEGNYWFSTYNNGLFRARRETVTPYGKAQGLDVKEVYPLLERRDGSLWIGADSGALFRLEDGVLTRYAVSDPLPRLVSSLYEDDAGQLWINGALRFVDGRLVRAPWTDTMPDTQFLACRAMYEDRDGAFWVGTGTGVARHLDGVSTYYTTRDGLAGNDTKVIIGDGEGGLWIGSHGGLTRYRDGRFTAWTVADGLPGDTVRALKLDDDGTLWIGTYDSGLGRLKDGRFTTYTTKDGLFDNGVFQILEDDSGRLWMSCNRGIYRVRKQELHDFAEGRIEAVNCLAYTKSDGMPSSECNGGRWPAGVKTRDGRLWFPTMGGVAMIDPSSIVANTQPPPVVIEAMRINNEPAPLDAWDSAIGDLRSAIEIPPGKDNFAIEYTALSFINSENIRFKYKLEGADEEWVDAGTRRTAYFSHLPPGDYTFRAIAANADGVWNETGASVRITVVPPFWRTWWFAALAVALVIGAVAMAHSVRIAQLERAKATQEEYSRRFIEVQEHDRKRIASELHDSLSQSLVIIKNRALHGLEERDDAENALEQLEEISEAATHALGEVRQIAYDLRPFQIDRLGLTAAVEAMVKKIAGASGLHATTDLDDIAGLLPPEREIDLYRIVQESLNNVVKHARATEVHVTIRTGARGIDVTIRDDGRGFAPGAVRSDAGAGGFGLLGMAERARILDAAIDVESSPGHGTSVRVHVRAKGGGHGG